MVDKTADNHMPIDRGWAWVIVAGIYSRQYPAIHKKAQKASMSLELHLHHEYTFISHLHHQLPMTPAVVMRYSLSHKKQ